MTSHLLIVGASVRAAAFSALKAGLQPYAIDLFADRDLAAVCPVRRISTAQYPATLAEQAPQMPAGPWLYTGALENWPTVVQQISQDRPLWGNGADCLSRVRDPFALAGMLRATALPSPEVRLQAEGPPTSRWLHKPIAGGGGSGISFARGDHSGRLRNPARPAYLQEFIKGESRAGVFIADSVGCRLLGVTQQLVGEKWLHAAPFRYAGSIGPLSLQPTEQTAWERLGTTVAAWASLRGLFGIDAVIRDGVPWPVEVNPRYTASVEVLEYATGIRALALHRQVFEPTAPAVGPGPAAGIVGKAVWFAPRRLTFPADGAWEAVLREMPTLDAPPAFADIPRTGQRIAAGRPVITMFATAATVAECRSRLREVAAEIDARLLR
jgi:uncharacterized protein